MDFTVQGGMKITTVLHAPGWHRTRLIRRAIAILLILVSAALALHSALKKDPQVVVAVRTIDAGSTVTAEDVALRRVPQNLLPEGTFDSTDDVVGHVAVAAISPNEIPSHLRFVGSELASYLVNLDTPVTNQETDSAQENLGPPTLVPIKLADPTLAHLLNHGDTVTVVTHDDNAPEPITIAAGGRVVLSTLQQKSGGFAASSSREPGTILIALPETPAKRVAAASLTSPLAVVLTGERAKANGME